jgi:hypothetical protein
LVLPDKELVGIRPGRVSAAPGWGLSPLGWQAHAVAVHADHAVAALIVRRRRWVLMVTALGEDPPGRVWSCCIGWSPR